MAHDELRTQIRELGRLVNSVATVLATLIERLDAHGLVSRREILDAIERPSPDHRDRPGRSLSCPAGTGEEWIN